MNTASWAIHFVSSDRNPSLAAVAEAGVQPPPGAKRGWEEIIETLRSWAENIAALEDKGVIPPSYPIVRKGLSLSHTLMARGWAPPFRVVPNTDGGILFEHGDDELFETIEIYSNGDLEYVAYEKNRVVCMKPLDLHEIR